MHVKFVQSVLRLAKHTYVSKTNLFKYPHMCPSKYQNAVITKVNDGNWLILVSCHLQQDSSFIVIYILSCCFFCKKLKFHNFSCCLGWQWWLMSDDDDWESLNEWVTEWWMSRHAHLTYRVDFFVFFLLTYKSLDIIFCYLAPLHNVCFMLHYLSMYVCFNDIIRKILRHLTLSFWNIWRKKENNLIVNEGTWGIIVVRKYLL